MTESEKKGSSACCGPARVRDDHALGHQTFPTSDDSVEHDIVDIPGGTGFLGTDRPELAIDGEAPFRQSKVKPFRIDTTTVTVARFAAFVAATGYKTEAERLGDSFVFRGFLSGNALNAPSVPGAPWWLMIKGATWRAIYGPGSEADTNPDHPVVHVSWNDAIAFASWAGGRLPTEAEWEHAARGGLGDIRFPWGDKEPDDTNYFPCNIWQGRFPDKDMGRDGYIGTAPAQSFEPNPYGLFNMVGNVWEWTSQPFTVRSLKKSVKRAHRGKAGFKITKGGSFLCHLSYCYRYRIAARTGTSPDSAMSHQGFRLVYDVKA
ncbi:formylglycine-generating enzyme family protein [Cognatishimia sp. WU-CL00825]|uniref:formylglycine-generating enzyme family protein n=1 Tax=Cognatishimia sp. WU-CL00825 TaxID=3127658 RepID=UPI0031089730